MENVNQYNITFNEAEMNLVMTALSELPAKFSRPLLNKIEMGIIEAKSNTQKIQDAEPNMDTDNNKTNSTNS